jgi:alpha/beta hydrolase family protein
MIARFFHRWEQQLAEVSSGDRIVRPFDWGLDWMAHHPKAAADRNGHVVLTDADAPHLARVHEWVTDVMRDTDTFFTPAPTSEYTFTPADTVAQAGGEAGTLTFPSGFTTPHPENNTVYARYFPAKPIRKPASRPRHRRAVVVLAQWNSDAGGHVGLCKLLARLGIASLRISLPYHDRRMPPELTRADYIVSSNIVRTIQVCRQAVMDVRRALWWLRDQGYDRLGLLGTSLGSCLAMLTGAHEPLVRAQALNHVSPYFGDVVWRGLSTEHVRAGLDGHIELDLLRALWKPISPRWYLERVRDRDTLLVYARYDLSFPVDLSEDLVHAFRDAGVPHEVAVLRCGHYSTGKTPFKYVDGWVLTRFLKRILTKPSTDI